MGKEGEDFAGLAKISGKGKKNCKKKFLARALPKKKRKKKERKKRKKKNIN
jgi:hypothetical protein